MWALAPSTRDEISYLGVGENIDPWCGTLGETIAQALNIVAANAIGAKYAFEG